MVRFLAIVMFLATVIAPQSAQSQEDDLAKRVVSLPMQNGTVSSSDLFNAVSGEMHWVAGSVTAFSRVFGVESAGLQRLPKDRVDRLVASFPDVFSIRPDKSSGEQNLVIDVDELAEQLANKKSELRKYLAGAQGQTLATLQKVESTWSSASKEPRRIIVVLSGLHGIESTSDAVALQLHERRELPMCVFAYPNDGPILESAELLVENLQKLHRQYPNANVTLVTHSMGGLVSRAALEISTVGSSASGSVRSSVAERTGVDQLIQVCPPNHGSALADYGPLLEGAEQAYRLLHRRGEQKTRRLFRSIVDGFNEASEDLNPESRFFAALNKAERNPDVRYTILAGNAGPLKGGMTTLLGSVWDRISSSVNEPEALNQRIRDVLECAELQNGKGDGVVSLESARLDGVTDMEILPMHHLVWNELESEEGKQMLDAVVQRLGISL